MRRAVRYKNEAEALFASAVMTAVMTHNSDANAPRHNHRATARSPCICADHTPTTGPRGTSALMQVPYGYNPILYYEVYYFYIGLLSVFI